MNKFLILQVEQSYSEPIISSQTIEADESDPQFVLRDFLIKSQEMEEFEEYLGNPEGGCGRVFEQFVNDLDDVSHSDVEIGFFDGDGGFYYCKLL